MGLESLKGRRDIYIEADLSGGIKSISWILSGILEYY